MYTLVCHAINQKSTVCCLSVFAKNTHNPQWLTLLILNWTYLLLEMYQSITGEGTRHSSSVVPANECADVIICMQPDPWFRPLGQPGEAGWVISHGRGRAIVTPVFLTLWFHVNFKILLHVFHFLLRLSSSRDCWVTFCSGVPKTAPTGNKRTSIQICSNTFYRIWRNL